MKQISIFIVGFAASFAIAQALAEDFTAGKTPAQLFRSDCGECHHSPTGLVKERDVGALTAFLSEHYTTKSDTAAALAAYVSGFAPTGTASRNRGMAGLPVRERTRGRSSQGDAPTTAVNVPADPRPADDPAVRRRRTSVSAEGEKRGTRDDSEVPRPPRAVGTASPRTASPGSNTPTRVSEPHEADPVSRLRSYLSSGLNSENATAQAGRTGAPKVRKRRNSTGDGHAGPKANSDAPAATSDVPSAAPPPADAPPADAPPAAAPGEQQ